MNKDGSLMYEKSFIKKKIEKLNWLKPKNNTRGNKNAPERQTNCKLGGKKQEALRAAEKITEGKTDKPTDCGKRAAT